MTDLTPKQIRDKAIFQFKGQLAEMLQPLERYGQRDYVEECIPHIADLALQLHERLTGNDIPIIAKKPRHYTP